MNSRVLRLKKEPCGLWSRRWSKPFYSLPTDLSLDEIVARDPARIVCYERAGRESNLLSHVLRTGSQVNVRKMIDEVMCQRVYGALPLSYGAMF